MTFNPRLRPPQRPEASGDTAPYLPGRSSPAAPQPHPAATAPTRLAREREAFHVISEAAYRTVFENAPAALWVDDFSEVRAHVNRLQHCGVDDLATYFDTHPEAVAECAGKIRILDANRQALELHRAPSKEALVAGLSRITTPGACKVLAISGYTQLMLWNRNPEDPGYPNLRAIIDARKDG